MYCTITVGSCKEIEVKKIRFQTSPILTVIGGISALILAMGFSRFGYTPILSLMQRDIGLSEVLAGLLASANYAGYLIGALCASKLTEPKTKQTLELSLLTNILSLGAMALTTNFFTWTMLRLISGISSGLIFVIASGIVLQTVLSAGYKTWVGYFYSGVGLGIAATGILVPALDQRFGWSGAWLGLCGFGIIFAVLTRRLLPDPKVCPNIPAQSVPVQAKRQWNWLLAAYGCEGLGYIITGTFLVAIVAKIPGLHSLAMASWTIVGLAAAPSAFLWSYAAQRLGIIESLIAAFVLQIAGVLCPLIAPNQVGTIAGAVLFGGTFMGITTLTAAAAGHIFPHHSTQAIGQLTAVYAVGQMIGPSIAGLLASDKHDYKTALLFAAAVLLLGIFLLIISEYKRKGGSICRMLTSKLPEKKLLPSKKPD